MYEKPLGNSDLQSLIFPSPSLILQLEEIHLWLHVSLVILDVIYIDNTCLTCGILHVAYYM